MKKGLYGNSRRLTEAVDAIIKLANRDKDKRVVSVPYHSGYKTISTRDVSFFTEKKS